MFGALGLGMDPNWNGSTVSVASVDQSLVEHSQMAENAGS